MMNEMNAKKMEQLLNEESFFEKLKNVDSMEVAYQLFTDNGIDVSYDEFQVMISDSQNAMLQLGLLSEGGELDEDSLDTVSGGAHCRVCNSHVKDGFWNMYKHCFKHAWNATMPIVQVMSWCFGIAKV